MAVRTSLITVLALPTSTWIALANARAADTYPYIMLTTQSIALPVR